MHPGQGENHHRPGKRSTEQRGISLGHKNISNTARGAKFMNSTLLNHGSWRISAPRLCTMQGPGIAAENGLDPRRLAVADRAMLHILCLNNSKSGCQNSHSPKSQNRAEASDLLPHIPPVFYMQRYMIECGVFITKLEGITY